MNPPLPTAASETRYQLRFTGLYDRGRGYTFPCDAAGHVDLPGLGARARESYRQVRAGVGTEYSEPVVDTEH